MSPTTKIDFVIDKFSSVYTYGGLGAVDDPVNGITDASAVAVFYMSQAEIQNVFYFETDSLNFSDISYERLHYFIYMNRWPSHMVLAPTNGMMDQAGSSNAMLQIGIPNKMLVKHDFVRYLASSLFNTPNGVDLFNNQETLLHTLDTMGQYSWQNDISASLWKYATTSSYPVPADVRSGFIYDQYSNLKCTTADLPMDVNLGCKMMNQLLMLQPERFNHLVLDDYGQAPIPILAGDTIQFLFTIYPAPGQNNLTGVPAFGGRSYAIKIIIDNGEHQNTVSID
jgi:hypothetical protein